MSIKVEQRPPLATVAHSFRTAGKQAPREMVKALRERAGKIALRLQTLTPPKRQRQGEKTVKRDIHRAITPMDFRKWRNKRIRQMVMMGDNEGLQALFKNSRGKGTGIVRIESFTPKHHQSVRDYRGRVNRWQGVLTGDRGEVGWYVEDIQKRVGIAKGGWASSVANTGGEVFPWAARHRKFGRFKDTLSEYGGEIHMENLSRWGGYDAERIVNYVLKSEDRPLRKSVESAARRALTLSFGSINR